jgi:hypothetical protein
MHAANPELQLKARPFLTAKIGVHQRAPGNFAPVATWWRHIDE